MTRTRKALVAVGLAAAVAGSGCGSQDEPERRRATAAATATTGESPASTTTEAAPPATTTGKAPATTATTTTETQEQDLHSPDTAEGGRGEDQQGGAGDEEGALVRARFEVGRSGIEPGEVTVPAFFPVEVELASTDGREHDVLIATDPPIRLHVPAGGHASQRIASLEEGTYGISLDGAASDARLVVGGRPG